MTDDSTKQGDRRTSTQGGTLRPAAAPLPKKPHAQTIVGVGQDPATRPVPAAAANTGRTLPPPAPPTRGPSAADTWRGPAVASAPPPPAASAPFSRTPTARPPTPAKTEALLTQAKDEYLPEPLMPSLPTTMAAPTERAPHSTTLSAFANTAAGAAAVATRGDPTRPMVTTAPVVHTESRADARPQPTAAAERLEPDRRPLASAAPKPTAPAATVSERAQPSQAARAAQPVKAPSSSAPALKLKLDLTPNATIAYSDRPSAVPKSRAPLIIGLAVAILLVGGGVWVMTSGSHAANAGGDNAAVAAPVATAAAPPVAAPVEPAAPSAGVVPTPAAATDTPLRNAEGVLKPEAAQPTAAPTPVTAAPTPAIAPVPPPPVAQKAPGAKAPAPGAQPVQIAQPAAARPSRRPASEPRGIEPSVAAPPILKIEPRRDQAPALDGPPPAPSGHDDAPVLRIAPAAPPEPEPAPAPPEPDAPPAP